jgi:hypothetical protein
MYVIQPDTKAAWKRTLTEEYHVEEQLAKQLVGYIGSGLTPGLARPESGDQVEDAADAIRDDLKGIDFADFGTIEDSDAVRAELMLILRENLGLTQTGAADAAQGDVSVARASKGVSDEELDESVQELADILADAIEDEDHPMKLETLPAFVEAVRERVSGQPDSGGTTRS